MFKVARELAVIVDAFVVRVPFAVFSVRPLVPPDAIVPVLANVNAVDVVVIVFIDATPVSAPAVVTFNPPEEVRANVPVEFPIFVFPLPVVFSETVPPATVSPALPVISPAEVTVPVPVVDKLPDVVIASPLLMGERVVVFLCQY